MSDPNPTSSIFNPADMATKIAGGDISANITVGDFLQKNFGVTFDTPMSEFVKKLQGQVQTATMPGKLAAMGGGGGMPPRPAGQPPVSSMGDLASRLSQKGQGGL